MGSDPRRPTANQMESWQIAPKMPTATALTGCMMPRSQTTPARMKVTSFSMSAQRKTARRPYWVRNSSMWIRQNVSSPSVRVGKGEDAAMPLRRAAAIVQTDILVLNVGVLVLWMFNMRIFVPTEFDPSERRVPVVPSTVGRLVKLGALIEIETGLGRSINFSDADYE